MTAKSMNAGEWTILLSLSAIWGCSFFFVALALVDLPFVWVAVGRVAIAAVLLHLAALAMRLPYPRDLRTWGQFFVLGLFNNAIAFGLIFWAQTAIPSGLAAILNACTPLFAMVLAHFLTRDERLSARRVLGVAMGIAGVAAMMGLQALDRIGTELWAQIAMLGAGLSYAIAGLYGRRLRHVPPMLTAAGQTTCASLMLIPVALVWYPLVDLAMPGTTTWLALLGLAGPCTALGYWLYFRLLATAGATNLLLVTLLIPVGAIALGTLVLGETLLARHLIGMALIAAGLVVIDGRLTARGRRAAVAKA
jgi:drug/metabolite transporter (DMT)-like permease